MESVYKVVPTTSVIQCFFTATCHTPQWRGKTHTRITFGTGGTHFVARISMEEKCRYTTSLKTRQIRGWHPLYFLEDSWFHHTKTGARKHQEGSETCSVVRHLDMNGCLEFSVGR